MTSQFPIPWLKIYDYSKILTRCSHVIYFCSQIWQQANLVNVSVVMSIKKNLTTLLNTSPTYSAYKLCAKRTCFYYETVPTWLGYYTICDQACENQPSESKKSLIFHVSSIIT